MKKIIKYVLLMAFLVIAGFYISVKYFGAEEGDLAPDFEAMLIDGTPFKLSDLKGKYVLLDFWGSWCPPCRKENSQLVKLHDKYYDELALVTVALEKDSLSWKKVADLDGFKWKHQIVNYNKFVMLSPVARKYGVTEIPAKFLIAPDGKLIGRLSFKQIDSVLVAKNR